jgi:uncharacterized OB-fold protein
MKRPAPHIGFDDGPFWHYCQQEELRIPRCRACGRNIWPVLPACPHDLSDDLEWVKAPDRGTISSWTIYHRAFDPEFGRAVPYVCASIELAEGVRMTGNVFGPGRDMRADRFLGDAPETNALNGREVRLFFERSGTDVVIPQWELLPENQRPPKDERSLTKGGK